jgi:Family of unknown function (DUF6151)
MPLHLLLRCQCGRVSGVATNVSPSTGFRFVCYCKDCQAFARFLDRPDVLDPAGGTDILSDTARAPETHRGHGRNAMPDALQQGFALVHRLLPDADCQHSRRAAFPCPWPKSFLHRPPGRRSFPGRGTRTAALPHLRKLRCGAVPTEHTRSAVGPAFGPPYINDSRLVGAWS